MFYEQYKSLCKSIGKSPSAVALEAGFSKSTVTFWKKKYEAGEEVDLDQDIVKKLCTYFNVTESNLRGLDEQQKKPTVVDDGLDELSEKHRLLFAYLETLSDEKLDEIIRILIPRKDDK